MYRYFDFRSSSLVIYDDQLQMRWKEADENMSHVI